MNSLMAFKVNITISSLDSSYKRTGLVLNSKRDVVSCVLGGKQAAITPVEDDGHLLSSAQSVELSGIQRNMNVLPRPLTSKDLSPSSDGCSNVRVAYKGAPGAFSEAAALKAYPLCETVPCEEFEAAFKAVELWVVNKAVLPIESSVGGSVHRNYDLLLRHRLHIVGEVQMVVQHCLLGLPGVRMEELKRVISHPQALAQCKINLNKLDVVKESVDDTVGAAQLVTSSNLKNTGAIACARAAEIYGLNILEERIEVPFNNVHSNEDSYFSLSRSIQNATWFANYRSIGQDDSDNNITRFLILSREPVIPRADRPFKTSIVFTLEEGPGILFKALAVFALRGINMTKIESRPQRKRPMRVVDECDSGSAKYFDYLFYIDFEASMAEPRAQNALGHLQELAPFLRVLGCYPIDTAQ
ncbi:hypothetical protein IFM89_032275 [Coptis chinensis]|uniref:Arogenate dehydratase n=1 Tax=Coptis chinensis TaxID=261450 RepID=A0A835H1X3_9MAGN|nr:hypothetical protein IFM89_032275 [Coptis chinensis]